MNDTVDNQNREPVFFSWLTPILKIFADDWLSLTGLIGIFSMLAVAICAPFIANGRPLLIYHNSVLSSPMLRYIFAPDSTEIFVEKSFNFILLYIPIYLIIYFLFKKRSSKTRLIFYAFAFAVLLIPFFTVGQKLDKTDWHKIDSKLKEGEFAIFAPVPYSPYANIAKPYESPSLQHWMGADRIGRDVMSRMIYGTRVSLAVGILATGTTMVIGVLVGLISGYFGGEIDIFVMRLVEIIICFPTFLLLLILMSMIMHYKFQQQILIVVGVIGITGWTGLCRLVRGEVLKQREMPYIKSAESLGIPVWRILLFHILPNVTGPIFVSFTFGVAGAILAESGLSFLGYGVQDPTSSWGELLRQSFDSSPFSYLHLTFWPGFILFVAVCSFNFAGEGLRKALDPKG